MGIGISVFLIAVGAVLTFAVNVTTSNAINLHTIGVILMAVGAIGLLATLTVFSSWGAGRRNDVVVEERRF